MSNETIRTGFEDDPDKINEELVTQVFIDMWLITGEGGDQIPDFDTPVYIDDETRWFYENLN